MMRPLRQRHILEIERNDRLLDICAEAAQRSDHSRAGGKDLGHDRPMECSTTSAVIRTSCRSRPAARAPDQSMRGARASRITRIGTAPSCRRAAPRRRRCRKRTQRIERGRQRQHAPQADDTIGRLESGHSAQRSGNTDQSADVRADRGRRERPATATAEPLLDPRDAVQRHVPRVPWRTQRAFRPGAEQIDQVRLAERNHPARQQALNSDHDVQPDPMGASYSNPHR